MASGKTKEMIAFSRYGVSQLQKDRPAVERDRSLRGKARRKVRKAENRG